MLSPPNSRAATTEGSAEASFPAIEAEPAEKEVREGLTELEESLA